jgi:hypothetical protein
MTAAVSVFFRRYVCTFFAKDFYVDTSTTYPLIFSAFGRDSFKVPFFDALRRDCSTPDM